MKEPYKSAPRSFKVWFPLPLFCLGLSIYLAIGPLIEDFTAGNAMAMIIIASGVFFYIPFVWKKLELPFELMSKFELFLQTYFEVVPVVENNKKD